MRIIIFSSLLFSSWVSYLAGVSRPKVIDVFLFNGEPASFFRLMYLYEIIDFFMLIESPHTLSGSKKDVLYVEKYRGILEIFSNKSVIEIIDTARFGLNSWKREKYLRNMARIKTLNRFKDIPYIAIFGDSDEIPNSEVIRNLTTLYDTTNRQHWRLEMVVLMYTFKWRYTAEPWHKTFVVNDVELAHKQSSDMFNLRFYSSEKNSGRVFIPDAGWHCTYFMNASEASRKLNSFAHYEYWGSNFSKVAWIQHCQDVGIHLLQPESNVLVTYNGSSGYPKCQTCTGFPGHEYFLL